MFTVTHPRKRKAIYFHPVASSEHKSKHLKHVLNILVSLFKEKLYLKKRFAEQSYILSQTSIVYCKPAPKSTSVNQKQSALPHLKEVGWLGVVSSYCLLCFPTSSCLLMSDTSTGTCTVRPSIDFLMRTWQPRRDLRRKRLSEVHQFPQ